MRHQSAKQRRIEAAGARLKAELLAEIGRCEVCGHNPKRVSRGNVAWALHLHEIARGCQRHKARGKRCASLLVCSMCHMTRLASRSQWPEARQLACLRKSRPAEYDLGVYNALVGWGPNRVTEEEVNNYA